MRTPVPTTSSRVTTRPTISASPTRRSPRCCSRRSRIFPLRVCEVAFSWLNLAALFGLLAVSLRAVCRLLDRRTILWWALVLLLPVAFFDPVRQTFLLGQVNIILALMVVADMTMDLPVPRGVLVGLAAAIKLTPLILIPYLLMTRQGRAGVRAIVSFCAAALLGGLAQRVDVVVLLDALHPRPATGRDAVVGRQPRACSARSSGWWATP